MRLDLRSSSHNQVNFHFFGLFLCMSPGRSTGYIYIFCFLVSWTDSLFPGIYWCFSKSSQPNLVMRSHWASRTPTKPFLNRPRGIFPFLNRCCSLWPLTCSPAIASTPPTRVMFLEKNFIRTSCSRMCWRRSRQRLRWITRRWTYITWFPICWLRISRASDTPWMRLLSGMNSEFFKFFRNFRETWVQFFLWFLLMRQRFVRCLPYLEINWVKVASLVLSKVPWMAFPWLLNCYSETQVRNPSKKKKN